jgi:hypothetical protein
VKKPFPSGIQTAVTLHNNDFWTAFKKLKLSSNQSVPGRGNRGRFRCQSGSRRSPSFMSCAGPDPVPLFTRPVSISSITGLTCDPHSAHDYLQIQNMLSRSSRL